MALLLIAVIDTKTRIPAPDVTRAVITDLAKKYDNNSDKIRAMQHLNKHPVFKDINLQVTWRYEYGAEK